MPSASALFLGPYPNWALMHDNDPKFRSHVCRDRLRTLGVHLVLQPPQSPDLNSIEHVWRALKSVLETSRLTTLKGFRRSIAREWDRLDPILRSKLVESMSHRLSAVRQAKGGPTKY